MANDLVLLPLPLLEAVQPWLTLNSEYYVIICHCISCCYASCPGAASRHLYDKHRVSVSTRRQLQLYIEQWQWPYDFQSVPLPRDGSVPQPILPILDGFQCQDCGFKTTNRRVMRQHCNTKHNKMRFKDKELFLAVQLQT